MKKELRIHYKRKKKDKYFKGELAAG